MTPSRGEQGAGQASVFLELKKIAIPGCASCVFQRESSSGVTLDFYSIRGMKFVILFSMQPSWAEACQLHKQESVKVRGGHCRRKACR